MTEAEAHTRWCPFASARVVTSQVISVAVGPESTTRATTLCLAAKCMAWRWLPHAADDPSPREGYCGLAGRP